MPTNEHGHMHIMAFDPVRERSSSWEPASVDARLNAYRPWTVLLHQKHGESIARYIQERGSQVRPFSQNVMTDDEQIAGVNVGYAVRFDEPLCFADAYLDLLATAGALEMAYRRIDDLHRQFNIAPSGSPERAHVHQELVGDLCMMDVPAAEADDFAALALAARPTYSQLLTWLGDADDPDGIDHLRQQIQKYERMQSRIMARIQREQGVLSTLLAGMIADKSMPMPSSVLHEHLAATYIWRVAGDSKGDLLMTGYDLYISPDSTQSAPEILAGRSLRRSTGTSAPQPGL